MHRQIVFTGHVLKDSGASAMREDAQIARAQCAAHDITGLTLYSDGSFISALEGNGEALGQILTFYQIDERMGGVKPILDMMRSERDFANYEMGFRREDFVHDLDGTFALNARTLGDKFARVKDGDAKTLLRTFARVNGIAS